MTGLCRAAIALSVLILAGCTSDPTVELLRRHGWQPEGRPTAVALTVGDSDAHPMGELFWQLGLHHSQEVGMDFSPFNGQPGSLVSYDVGRLRDGRVRALILVVDGQPIGGWLDGAVWPCMDFFPLTATFDEVESCGGQLPN